MPVMRLKAVVLPAPLGPMRPWMQPLGRLRLKSLTARRPPKALVAPRHDEDVSPFLMSGHVISPPASPRPCTAS